MFTPLDSRIGPLVQPGPQHTLGTPMLPLRIAWGAMCSAAAFAQAFSAVTDEAGGAKPADNLSAGVSVFERGKSNQALIRAAVVGTGTVTVRVYRLKPNLDGSAFVKDILYVAVFAATAGGRAVPSSMLNAATGSAKWAEGLVCTSYHPMDRDAQNTSVPGSGHPAYLIVDPLGGDLLIEAAIDGGGATSFNIVAEWI